jgi:2-polyprenyl-6-methoxyphenol hydroxylase-like FAD-dependent oxidoreductase
MGVASKGQTEVLVVGAGPTGLVLALWLNHLGVDVRVVDRTAEAGTTSRALAVHARTLEFYRQLGLAQELVAGGQRLDAINLWTHGKRAARVFYGDVGEGLSPFPYVLIFPQDAHERLLVEQLRRRGVEVERNTQLLGFEERADRVFAQLQTADGRTSACEAAYIAGCDGAHSKVRETLDVGFRGGTYQRIFYVADVILRGPSADHELHIALDTSDLLAVFPMKGDRNVRLLGTVQASTESLRELTWSDVSQDFLSRMQVSVEAIRWFSTYRVHHRVADHFGRGRAFLLGDAAHIHSPVGGQGMNTGIGDAINLSWKLAAVLQGRADKSLLSSYEPERIAFARRLVATTDRAFTFATRDGRLARFVRLSVLPALLPRLTSSPSVRRFMFRIISQILLNYRGGPLSEGRAGRVHGGDRLPWVGSGGADNFAALDSFDWQVHVYGEPASGLSTACTELGLALHVFSWSDEAARAGLARSASYLVRPDGYVALAWADASADALKRYFRANGLRPRTPDASSAG